MLTRARQAALAEGLTSVFFLIFDASAPSFGPASFDAVLASLVVYLLADPAATVARWRNLLRPGGILGFTWVLAEDSRLEPVYAAVDTLAARHGYAIVHATRTPEGTDLFGEYRSILTRPGPLVLDRSFVSELVYGPMEHVRSRLAPMTPPA